MSTTDKNLNYSEQNTLPPGEFNPKDAKVKISIMLDGDILKACKNQANQDGIGYQTLINRKLREIFLSQKSSDLETRVSALERLLIERAVPSKRTKGKRRKAA